MEISSEITEIGSVQIATTAALDGLTEAQKRDILALMPKKWKAGQRLRSLYFMFGEADDSGFFLRDAALGNVAPLKNKVRKI